MDWTILAQRLAETPAVRQALEYAHLSSKRTGFLVFPYEKHILYYAVIPYGISIQFVFCMKVWISKNNLKEVKYI